MRTCLFLSAALAGAVLASPAQGQINYVDFSSVSGLQLNGDAAQAGTVLRVTPASFNQSGSAFFSSPVSLNNLSQFSTRFVFNISGSGGIGDGDGVGADGLVFVAQTVANTAGGSGGGIGYDGLANSVGVEFDTYNNGSVDGDNGNHVGIDLGGSINSVARMDVVDRLNNGQDWTAWIDYDGATLELRANQTGVRPTDPLLAYNVDLATVLGSSDAYVGFTSGTGSGFGNHDIKSWEFRSEYRPIDVPRVPEASSTILVLTLGFGVLIPCARLRHLPIGR